MGTTARTNVMDEDNILVSGVGTGSGNAVRVGILAVTILPPHILHGIQLLLQQIMKLS